MFGPADPARRPHFASRRMIAPDALDLHGVAVLLGVSYSQLQRT